MRCLRMLIVGLGFLAVGCNTPQPGAGASDHRQGSRGYEVHTAIVVDGNFGSRLIRGKPEHDVNWAIVSSVDSPAPTSDDQIIEAFGANKAVFFVNDAIINRPKWIALCSINRGTAASEFESVEPSLSADGVLSLKVKLRVAAYVRWTPREADPTLVVALTDARPIHGIVVRLDSRIGVSYDDVFYEEHCTTSHAEVSFR